MATKKQKRERGIAKRMQEEAERREREQHFLKLAQAQRAEQKRKADEARLARAKAKSKRLAKTHRAQKKAEQNGVKVWKPVERDVVSVLRPKQQEA